MPRQIVTADFIVEKIDAHSGTNTSEKTLLKRASDLIIAKNVELHQHVIASFFDSGKDRSERRVAVDEQLSVIAGGEGQLRQALERQFA